MGYDFRNFQPSLLSFYKEAGINQTVPKLEQEKYVELCRSGQLYDVLLTEPTIKYRNRNQLKKAFCTMLNLKTEELIEMPLFIGFSKVFPTYAQIIFDIKKDDHTKMAKFLHQKEAKIIFGHVVKDFVTDGNKPFFTVHDSVITTKTYHKNLQEIFNKTITNTRIPTALSQI